MNIRQHNSTIPGFTVRRSVALISAAILFSAPVQAKIEIGRLPSSVTGQGVIGAKPNVFLVIDNSGFAKPTSNGNFLQQISAALITTLPVLEGKVRLGYTVGLSDGQACPTQKLNGNVDRLIPYIKGLSKSDIDKNKNYVTGAEDFVFGETGSGFGELMPRDFRDNFARYIYSWIGGICQGSQSSKSGIEYKYIKGKRKQPPYAELSKDPSTHEAYKKAASDAGNPNSYPLSNYGGFQVQRGGFSPMADRVVQVLGIISDKNFLQRIAQKCEGTSCAGVSVKYENDGGPGTVLRSSGYYDYMKYDAYANAVDGDPDRDPGFPDDKNPLSCRKNYIILISNGPFQQPYNTAPNQSIGVYNVNGVDWQLPHSDVPAGSPAYGFSDTVFPYKEDTTLPYQYIKNTGDASVREIPNSTVDGGNIQGGAGKFLLSKLAMQSYYTDLRSNLPNNVPAYYQDKNETEKAGSIDIRKTWNRKNDPANWQHASFFALAYTGSYPSWVKVSKYNDNYQDLNPKYPEPQSLEDREKNLTLEGYFRAIEDGSIRSLNSPLVDLSRGGFGLSSKPRGVYIYRDAKNGSSGQDFQINEVGSNGSSGLESLDSLFQMDVAKAGIISRGGAYPVNDYESVKRAIANIAVRIEKAMASGITGAALGGSGRVTASSEASGNVSTLLTTYLNEETLSGNIFAFKNCPLISPTIIDENGRSVPNPAWRKNECGSRLWNAATALNNGASSIGQKTITNIIAADSADDQSAARPQGALFSWANIAKDKELKAQLSGGNDELGEARVNWVNGTLYSELPAAVRDQFRKRANIEIPIEGQRYKKDENGDLVKDDQGNYVKADPINIPNRIGEIVYAVPKSVDNVGTLNTTHPLYDEKYSKFVENTVKKRQPLVLAGANDGHLYAFTNPANRSYSELAFSYIPRAVIADGRLTTMTQSSTSAESKPPSLVNGPFTVRDAQVDGKWGTYVVGTLGAGGNTVYALDISNGRADTSMFKWEVNLGQGEIMSEPRIVWLRKPCPIGSAECKVDGKWVVLLASGYNAKDVSLVVLDLKDGSELARIRTGAQYTAKEDAGNDNSVRTCTLNPLPDDASDALKAIHNNLDKEIKVPASVTCDNGLGALTVFDADNDSGADFVFAGDLLGNVWKFDLTGFFNASGSQSTDLNKALKVAYNSPLFVATTSSDELIMPDTRQPITAMIELDDGAYGEGSMLYFGTGRLFNQNERNIPQPESLYGIWDIPRYTEQGVASFKLPLRRNGGSNYDLLRYRFVTIDSKDVVDPNSALKKFKELRTMIRIDNLETTDYLSFDLQGRNVNAAAKAIGWVADFPEAVNKSQGAERVVERARTFDGNVYFATFTPDEGKTPAEGCSPEKGGAGGKGRFYMMDRMTGGPLKTSPFDFNGDGKQDSKDGIKISKNGLGNGADNYTVDKDNNVNISVSGLMTGNGSSSILSIEGVKKRAEMAKMANCDYTRQIVFPATVDPNTGNPLVLTSCNINRYRVWKQPVID